MEWPANSGLWITITDPTLTAGIYEWDFTSGFVSGRMPSIYSAIDSNKFKLRYKMSSGCPFTSGDQIIIKTVAKQLCDSAINSVQLDPADHHRPH